MKIPAQYLTLYMLMIIGFLMICVFAAAFRKKIVLTVILVIILVGLAGVLVFGKKQVRYNRAPQGDLSILDVSIRDDGVYHDGKKLTIISRESGGLYISNGKMIKKSNKYMIPNRREPACLADGDVLADEYTYTEQYDKGEFDKFYYAVLGGICTDECLSKHLTKPEVAAVRKARDEE